MSSIRNIKKIITGHKTIEGAGVVLNRAIGFDDPYEYDPFLLFDDFSSDNPADYRKGFPWHPHRGIETITYVLKGTVEHQDSLGTRGIIGNGDIQWMTAGSGIYHQEMPFGDSEGKMYGFQLWANLPKTQKMTVPVYQSIVSQNIPVLQTKEGVQIRVIAGTYGNITGPVKGIAIHPEYYDILVPENTVYIHKTDEKSRVLLYVFEGTGYIDSETDGIIHTAQVTNKNMLLFEEGDEIHIHTAEKPVRFLYIAGMPIKEPVAWYGPIVMNTESELRTAYRELEEGSFIKNKI